MKIVSKKLFVLFSLIIFSCNKNNNHYSVINYDSDVIFYKLDICNEKKYYQTQNENWKETIKISKKIIAGDTIFLHKDITNAISYIKKHHLENECSLNIIISIKKSNSKFEDVWIWRQALYVAGEFGERAGRVELETLKFDGFRQGIKIIYKQNYLNYNTLNYKYLNGYWELISRESVIFNPDINKIEYCIDTINSECSSLKNNIIYITNQYIFESENKKCISN